MRPFITSERVYLRSYEENDYVLVHNWLNDSEVTHFMFYGQLPMTVEQTKKLLDSYLSDGSRVIFIICLKSNGLPLGICGFYDWHRTAHKAGLQILIGDKEAWGKGIGTEVVELLTWYGFSRLNLHRIYLGYTASNEAAGRAYEKAGYEREGVCRDDIYRNGRYYDSVTMAILRDDYMKKLWNEHQKQFAPKEPPGFLKPTA